MFCTQVHSVSCGTEIGYMSSGNFQITIGDCERMSTSSVCKFVKRIAIAIVHLTPRYIHFPEPEDTPRFVNEFHNIAGTPGVIGYIDVIGG